jgi:hypothetical protein
MPTAAATTYAYYQCLDSLERSQLQLQIPCMNFVLRHIIMNVMFILLLFLATVFEFLQSSNVVAKTPIPPLSGGLCHIFSIAFFNF